ncbi:NUDIX hydrolase [Halobacillus locisalis]|uniref:NUDIX hydrolase n=1 Tax=Halobacillus locisalis TaxID=220753 RepID=A0A838CP05_9BACI|nr:NUDIX hydrolase [Halobacillus locisalis]
MAILVSNKGHAFLEFLRVEEEQIDSYTNDAPLTHALVVVTYQNKKLVIFNKWRQNWELPGGMIDRGETPREAAIRELEEETNQIHETMSFSGLMKFRLKPDDRLEYGALYSCDLDHVRSFVENEEASSIHFWDESEDIGDVDEIDRELLHYG